MESILDHVLSAFVLELEGDLRPFPALFKHEIEDYQILVDVPSSMSNLLVEVVVPMLSALFRGFEVTAFWFEKYLSGNICPFELSGSPAS